MAKFDSIDMGYEPDEYVVQRDDGSCYKSFNNFSEAQSYYNYLQQLDDQRRTVAQNDEILANQKRIIDAQERNSRILQRTPVSCIPPASRQILDPEYKEWLLYKKETDPEFKRWKRQKEAEEARTKAEREIAMREAERKQELERLEQERIRHEREKKYKERIQKEIQERKIRAEKEAKDRAIKEEQERKIREERAARKRAKQKISGCILMFLFIVAVIIVFFSVFV